MRKCLLFLRTGFLATTVSSFHFVPPRRPKNTTSNKYFGRRRDTSTSTTWNAARSFVSSASFVTMTSSSLSTNAYSRCGLDYPELVVFDLDACFWDQEMYEMPSIPTQKNVVMGVLGGPNPQAKETDGVIGVYSGRNKIALHLGALRAIQEHYRGRQYPGMKICFASSADTPQAEQIGRASLKLLEVVPGVTIWDVVLHDWNQIDVNQIGRQPPLSSNKAQTHFPRIRDMTGIPYHKMLFFDDCNWGDHCGMVAQACTEMVAVKDGSGGTQSRTLPVVTHRTPSGLTIQDWKTGLDLYRKQAQQYA